MTGPESDPLPGDQIWVAQGTYTPTHNADRTISFNLINGVALYGGFSGIESSLDERAGLFAGTILSGDLLGNDGPGGQGTAENSYHVVYSSGTDAGAVLDGFTITAGRADGPWPHDFGGGLYNTGSPTIRRCRFVQNYADHGGAVHNGGGAPTFTDCHFINNTALNWGAGIDNFLAGPTVINSVFDGNSTPGDGAAMHSDLVNQPHLINCTITRNTAHRGGGMFTYAASEILLTNCILWNNSDSTGDGEAAQLYVNAPENNFVVNHSCVQGWTGLYGGAGNFSEDPRLVQPAEGNVRLLPDSPCVDAGDNDALPSGTTTDLDGQQRLVDGDGDGQAVVDIGAYELQIICPADLNGDGQINAADLAQLLGAWGPNPDHPADLNEDGVVNAADLAQLLGSWGLCE